jgi:hypothetical protein
LGLKDNYGLSWQITPTALGEMMSCGNKETIARVTEAFLKMKKFNIKELEKLIKGKGDLIDRLLFQKESPLAMF